MSKSISKSFTRRGMKRALRRSVPVASAVLGAACAATDARIPIVPSPAPYDLQAERVELASDSVDVVRGWFARGRPGGGVVVLLHGIGASRWTMLDRARFLHAEGFGVVLVDFRGHGESTPASSTYGVRESADAAAAVALARAREPGERVGVIGVSMGGAATLLGPRPLPIDALVLESVYPTIDRAVADRARAWLGPLGAPLVPLFLDVILPSRGVHREALRPIDRIAEQRAPILILAGTADRYTTIREARALYARAPEPKAFWAVDGAGHEDLHAFARTEYERRVGGFLSAELRTLPPGAVTVARGSAALDLAALDSLMR